MSLARIGEARGALMRAESEYTLQTNENRKRLTVESTLSVAKMTQKDAVSKEADGSVKETMNSFYQKLSAKEAENAAKWGLISAIAGAISSVAGGASEGGGAGAALAGLTSVFSVMGAYLAYIGAGDEAEMLEKQYGYISKDAAEDQKMLKAMDANPTK